MNAKAMTSKPSTHNPQMHFALTALRRHGLIAFSVGLLLSGAAIGVVWALWEPTYEAVSYVSVIQDSNYFQIVPEKNQIKTDAKSELAPINSGLVLQNVLNTEEVQKLPSFASKEMELTDLRKRVGFRSVGGPELFEIFARGASPTEAVTLAETITEKFLTYYKDVRVEQLKKLTKSLDGEIEIKRGEIADVTNAIGEILKNMQGSSVNSMFDPDGEYLSTLKTSHGELIIEDQVLRGDKAAIEAKIASGAFEILDSTVESFVDSNPQSQAIAQRLLELRTRLALGSKGTGHPAVKALQSEIDNWQNNLNQVKAQLRVSIGRQLAIQAKNSATEQLTLIEQKLASVTSKTSFFQAEIEKQLKSIKATNELRGKHEELKTELEQARSEFDRLVDRQNTIKYSQISLPYQVSRRESDTILAPKVPLELLPLKSMGIAGFAGLVIPFALAFLWELRVRRVSTVSQFVQNQTVPLIGEIAELPAIGSRKRQTMSKRLIQQIRLYQESVDSLSAMLSVDKVNGPRIIAITSAAGHEGKSTLSSQLAMSIARTHDARVLLIDTDLRSPTQHRLFECPLDPGLSEVLEQGFPWQEALFHSKIDNLDVLPAGRVKSNPSRCFSSHNWSELLADAKSKYDFVIIDTPPVLATSESMVICRSCQSTLVCLLRDVSRSESVKRALERLQGGEVNVLGCVMGGTPQSEYAYRYGSYGYNLSR